MTATDILKWQMNDGAFGDAFGDCEPIDIGGDFAVVAGPHSVVLCSESIGGTIMLPRTVIERMAAIIQEEKL